MTILMHELILQESSIMSASLSETDYTTWCKHLMTTKALPDSVRITCT